MAGANAGRSMVPSVTPSSSAETRRRDQPPSPVPWKPASSRCFSANAVASSTATLRSSRRASKGANWSFHSVHSRNNAKTQCSRPASGSTELNAWADAKKSAARVTAWEAFFDRLKVREKKSILIIAGAGGVGSIGIQLAKGAGLAVLATASRAESTAWVKSLGADQVLDHRKDLPAQLKALGPAQVDYIAVFTDLDAYWPAIGEVIAPQGGIVAIVGNQKPLAMDPVRLKSASLHWELMFTRPRFQTPDMIEQHRLLDTVAEWLDAGKLRCTLRETLSPISGANLRKAHERLESGSMIGKLVLKGWR